MFALALGAAAVLAVSAMGFGMARLLREQAFADAERNMGNLAHALAVQTSQAMQTLDVTLGAQLDDHLDEYARASGIGIPQRLEQIRATMPMLLSLALGDTEGRILHAAPHAPRPDAMIAASDTLQAVRRSAGGQFVFDRPPQLGTEHNRPLRIVRALRAADGSLTGMAGGDLDPDHFIRLFGSLRLGEGGAITLLRDDAVVLLRVPAVPGAVGSSVADGPATRATLIVERDGVVRHVSRLDGLQRVTAVWRVPGQPLYVAVSLPEAFITASWQQSMRTGAIGVGVLIVFLGLLGGVAYRAVRRRESVETRLEADAGRYRLLFERNPDPMWMFDQGSGAILDVNAAAVAAYGYARDEFLRMSMADLRDAGAQTGGDGGARQHRRKDGSVLDVEVSHDSFDLDGRIVGLALARDVSARIAAERRLADFVAASADWMWETDADLRMIWLSPNVEQILGVSPASHYGKRREDFVVPGTNPAGLAVHQAEIAARRPFKDFEYLRETPSGPRWVRTSGVPYFDADRIFLGYRGVGQDITDLKTIQGRLIDALESIPAGVRILDAEDRVVLENARNRAMLPRADAGIESRGHFEDILRALVERGEIPAARQDPERWIAERLAAHRHPGDPIPITYADGHTLEIHERRLRDGGYIVLRFDITARLEAERRLAESEARYRLLFQRNPDPIWVFDRVTLAFLEVNEAAVRTYGFSREEFRHLTLKDIRPPEEVPALLAAHQGWGGEPAREGRWRHRRRDGSTFEVETSHDLLTIDGRECVMSQVRDVSARAAAERRLQDFMSASADWLWETDGSLRFTWTSSNFEETLGQASGEFGDLRGIGLRPGQKATEAETGFLRLIEARLPFKDFEFPIDGPMGLRWLRVSGVPYFEGDDGFLGYRGVGRDISDIKVAQARLLEAIESIPAGVVVFDRDERVVMANSNTAIQMPEAKDAQPLLGRSFEEALRGQVARGAFVDAVAEPERWIAWRMAVHRNPGPPLVLRLSNGRAMEVHERRMSDGGCILLRFDVTDRLVAEERLAASEARLKAAMDATVDGIVMIGADGTIVTVNKSAEHMFGYAETELVGRNVNVLMPDPYRSEHDRYLVDYLRTRQAKVIGTGREVKGLRKDGSEFDLDLAVAELPREVGTGRFIGTVRDITQRKQLDMQLREAQKLQALGQLTGGIAHDFNNLLAVITLNLESAAPRAASDRLLKEMIELSLQAAGRGAELTSRLLAIARRQPLMPRPLDLGGELHELGRLLQRIMPEQISVLIRAGGEPIAAELDGAQLQNALLNLALNARDAMSKGGRLTISLAATCVQEHEIDWPDPVPAGDYAVISVQDTGEGIAPDILYRVLDPFFTTKPAGQGTGLGLSMVYGFVRQSGGWLQIETGTEPPGTGTTIRLLFRRSTAPPRAQAPGPAEAPEAPHRRILLVEDYDDLRRSLAAMLRLLDCEVVATADAEAALAVLDGPEQFDGLITDIGLPGEIDGWKLARLALARRPGLKIITMSGHADPTEPEAGERPWSGPHLPKPFQRADMAAALKAAFGGAADRSG
ncbi:PAS domain S-box protein [Desertibaculum subflavum]|uniref:PAS domain S-box protein n=1 Tax=Desertibaculum subflavum TaxID=2268458 RepID=UPI0013C50CBF